MGWFKGPFVRLVAGIVLSALLFYILDWSEIMKALTMVPLPCVFLLLILQLATVLLAAVLWLGGKMQAEPNPVDPSGRHFCR